MWQSGGDFDDILLDAIRGTIAGDANEGDCWFLYTCYLCAIRLSLETALCMLSFHISYHILPWAFPSSFTHVYFLDFWVSKQHRVDHISLQTQTQYLTLSSPQNSTRYHENEDKHNECAVDKMIKSFSWRKFRDFACLFLLHNPNIVLTACC